MPVEGDVSPPPFSLDAQRERIAFAAAGRICRRHARSFHFASHFLPRAKRHHAYAVYAFCRLLDDAVDEPDDRATPVERRIERFARTLDAVYGDWRPAGPREGPERLALDAFAISVRRCAIPIGYFRDLAEGCRMDLEINRYETWADLERYCYRVAGVVGLIMCGVFGLEDESALNNAVQMGNAMQLTNILRDVKEDYHRGRIYLPREDMDRFGYGESDLAAGKVNDAFRGLIRFEIARARDLYARAADGLAALPDDGSRFTACAMAVIYAGILGAIERQGLDVFARRARLGPLAKLLRLPAAYRLSRRRPGEALPAVF